MNESTSGSLPTKLNKSPSEWRNITDLETSAESTHMDNFARVCALIATKMLVMTRTTKRMINTVVMSP